MTSLESKAAGSFGDIRKEARLKMKKLPTLANVYCFTARRELRQRTQKQKLNYLIHGKVYTTGIEIQKTLPIDSIEVKLIHLTYGAFNSKGLED